MLGKALRISALQTDQIVAKVRTPFLNQEYVCAADKRFDRVGKSNEMQTWTQGWAISARLATSARLDTDTNGSS